MTAGLFLWGALSQARLVAALLTRAGTPPTHLFDHSLAAPAFATNAVFSNEAAGLRAALRDCSRFVVCIGGFHGAQRAALSLALRDRGGLLPLSVISPDAWIDPEATLEEGVQIMPRACVMLGTTVGAFSLLNTNCTVDHECRIGRGVHVMGAAAIAGRVTIGDHASIGTNATILPDLRIGAGARVGAGAVCLSDIGENAVVVGVPARPIRTEPPLVDLSWLEAALG